jgi:hypothetical protein
MELVNILVSAILGFLGGFLSSYIFWEKQRKLDKPRLVLEYNEDRFSFKNKGGSFAESVRYECGYFHLPGQPAENREISFDDAIAPGENIPIGLTLEHRDALMTVTYGDVFGKQYKDVWRVVFDIDVGDFFVIKE